LDSWELDLFDLLDDWIFRLLDNRTI
jgi:hypothetical protein